MGAGELADRNSLQWLGFGEPNQHQKIALFKGYPTRYDTLMGEVPTTITSENEHTTN
jgi:hypothetical protein